MDLGLGKVEYNRSQNVNEPETKATIEYKVTGLPSEEDVRIGKFGDEDWRIFRVKENETWTGSYRNPDEAIAELQKEYDLDA
jgi:hypothetical protein